MSLMEAPPSEKESKDVVYCICNGVLKKCKDSDRLLLRPATANAAACSLTRAPQAQVPIVLARRSAYCNIHR